MNRRLQSIDVARGFAALYIMIFHLYHLENFPPLVHMFFEHGKTAVQLFFVLSGYLLTRSLTRRTGSEDGWRLNFYVRRAFRILPLYWALLIAIYLIGRHSFENLILNAVFAFGYMSLPPSDIFIYPAWSLFVEEVFYILLPLIFPRVRHWLPATLTVLLIFGASHYWVGHFEVWGFAPSVGRIGRDIFLNIHFLFIGLILAVTLRPERFSSRYRPWLWLGVAVFFVVKLPIEISCTTLASAVILAQDCGPSLPSRIFAWLGRRCYAIYLIHTLAFASLLPLLTPLRISHGRFMVLLGVLGLALTLILAELSWRFWELPWQRLGARLAVAWQRPTLARLDGDAATG